MCRNGALVFQMVLSYNRLRRHEEDTVARRRRIATEIVAIVLAAVVLFSASCEREEATPVIAGPAPGIVVYGVDSCGNTVWTMEQLANGGLRFVYKDVDDDSNSFEMWVKVRDCSWYDGEGVTLPIVDVFGVVLENPTIEEIQAEL
jgi:hypothetical protein